MAESLRGLGADVVVSNTLTICAGAFAARWSGTPHVWYVHELFGRLGHSLHFDFGDRLSLSLMGRLSEAILTNSPSVQREFQKWIPAHKVRQIYYAVETGEPPPAAEKRGDALELIQVGLMSPGKRQEEAVRAVALLAGRGRDVRLTLVGPENPEYGALLRRLTAELGVEGRVRFVPFTEDVSACVAAADVALLCSRGEAFGRVTVEAMKLGKPVVGANSGGTADLIEPGVNGFLYEPGDVEELARRIDILYHDRALVGTLGAEARRWSSETFNLDKYARELLGVLDDAAGAGRRGKAGAGRAGRE
jgi:glycosyltransferase involved in cell wall biosynthesis